MTATSSNPFPFEFAPSATQDVEFLHNLDFVPGLKEILTLRQVHALEHATVWVLSEWSNSGGQPADSELSGGMSTDQGFYLYGHVEPRLLQRAVQTALQRITQGQEWNLAVHPRCGTNLSVAMLLTAGLAMGVGLFLPRDPLSQLMGVGLAATAATQLAPDVGELAQRYITTAIPFNLQVVNISASVDVWGRPAHFVQTAWVDSNS